MRWPAKLRLRLRSLFLRERVDSELDEELCFHVQQQIDEYRSQGMMLEDARLAALRDLGGLEQRRHECRDQRGLRWLEELGQDVRFGLRMLRRYPVLSLTVVVTLGLGIGLTSTVFNITNGFVHKPLPFAESGRLMVVDLENRQTGTRNLGVTLADLADWREQQSSFERLDAFGAQPIDLSWERGRSEHLPGGLFTSGVFDALRVQPVLGRTFRPEEERPGAAPVIILGYDLWQTRFLGARDVLGRTIVANGVLRTVVGVMPRGFRFPNIEQAWLPIEVNPLEFKRGEGPRYPVLARLRDGVSARRARIEVAALDDRLDREYPRANHGADTVVRTLKQALVPAGLFGLFYMLLAVALGVLLVGCANVANLLLARASARVHEVALRSALGAGRGRLIRQLVTEVLVLAALGGAIGIVLGHLGLRWFTAQLFGVLAAVGEGELPFWIHFEHDYRVVLFVAGSALFSGISAAIVPAVRASGAGAAEAMKARSGSAMGLRMGRFSSGLVITEVAAACALLVFAGLMLKSVVRVTSVEPGYSTGNVFTSRLSLPERRYPDAESRRRVYGEVLRKLEAIPTVESAGLADSLPPYLSGRWTAEVEGHWYPADDDLPIVRRGLVTQDFFRTLEAPVLRGRAFNSSDTSDALPVAIVNASFVREHVPEGNPLGRRVRLRQEGAPWMTIVGVVRDLKAFPLGLDGVPDDQQRPACIYVPLMQADVGDNVAMAVRTLGPPMAITADVRRAAAAVDPDAALYRVLSMDGVILRMTWGYPVFATLFMTFGAGALLLAAVGHYGVMSFAVSRRTQELGVRMALGAEAGRLVWFVMRKGLIQMGIGLGIGLAVAALGLGPLQLLLYDVDALDPGVIGIVVLTLAGTGLAASFLPARRVTRIDPVAALTTE